MAHGWDGDGASLAIVGGCHKRRVPV